MAYQVTDCFTVEAPDSALATAMVDVMEVYPDFPKKGVNFVDIFPMFRCSEIVKGLPALMEASIAPGRGKITAVAGPESRGFLYGLLLAEHLGVPFIPFRKPHKLPCQTLSQSYALEYGEDTLEFPAGILTEADNVLIVDDLLALGGTMSAMMHLIEDQTPARVHSGLVVIDLLDLPKQALPAPAAHILGLIEK